LRKTESDRLSFSLIISIIFHAFLFFTMNLLDWFPDIGTVEKFKTLTVKIEKLENVSTIEEVLEPTPEITNPKPVAEAEVEENLVEKPVGPEESTVYDPYSDLSFDNSRTNTQPGIRTPNEGTHQEEYIPSGEDTIELETPLDEGGPIDTTHSDNQDQSQKLTDSVISTNQLSGLEQALDSNPDRTDITGPEELNRDPYTYNDNPVQFNNPGVNRNLLGEPIIAIPPDLFYMLVSESTVIVEFFLNEDGRLSYLKIKQSSGYSEIDNSIRSELRKWEFDKAPGSLDVEGTVTIILKGR
jgi:TonB family protein